VEQCHFGDVLVVTTTSPCTDGAFGELLGTALQHRGVRGLVTSGGVRDVAELHAMGFPVFCAAVSAQGTVKATPGAVVVPRSAVASTLAAAKARTGKESASRDAFRRGELGLDRYGLRAVLAEHGVEYVDYDSHREAGP
jgi:4-hydroxy-4-methyl-2-oxoglutarate aldolase